MLEKKIRNQISTINVLASAVDEKTWDILRGISAELTAAAEIAKNYEQNLTMKDLKK